MRFIPSESGNLSKVLKLSLPMFICPLSPIIKRNKSITLSGIGVFHRDRLVGKLSENETRMAGIVMGKPMLCQL